MAEHSKGGIFTRAQKTLTRTKTKVLQNLGKAEKTSDDRLNEHIQNLNKQQDVAHRLQKELRAYLQCARALQNVSKSLHSVIKETVEQDWGLSSLDKNIEDMELMWNDYVEKLQQTVQEPLQNYSQHIPQLKHKISKRGRKLVDYDNARHNAEVLQNAKKKDDSKIAKANDELEEAKKIYTHLNEQLLCELPKFYNSRIHFYGSELQNLFSAESIFHEELGKITAEMSKSAQDLAESHEEYKYTPRASTSAYQHTEEVNDAGTDSEEKQANKQAAGDSAPPLVNGTGDKDSPPDSPIYQNGPSFENKGNGADDDEEDDHDYEEPPVEDSDHDSDDKSGTEVDKNIEKEAVKEDLQMESKVNDKEPSLKTPDVEKEVQKDDKVVPESNVKEEDAEDESSDNSVPDNAPPAVPESVPPPLELDVKICENSPVKMVMKTDEEVQEEDLPTAVYDTVDGAPVKLERNNNVDFEDDDVYEVPKSNAPVVEKEVIPPGTLYKVRTTHAYNNEDVDELSFESGDIIYVVPYDDPEEQDEGWAMGILKSTGKKGVFPENFTKRESN